MSLQIGDMSRLLGQIQSEKEVPEPINKPCYPVMNEQSPVIAPVIIHRSGNRSRETPKYGPIEDYYTFHLGINTLCSCIVVPPENCVFLGQGNWNETVATIKIHGIMKSDEILSNE